VPAEPIEVNGWRLYAHRLFVEQLAALVHEVERLRDRDPHGYRRRPAAKRLAAIRKLTMREIPADPASPAYRLGKTIGGEHAHWRRAKFYQRYRLFFRFHSEARIIVYAWVNDDATLRTYGAADDAYAVFRRMLEAGDPPSSWEALVAAARPVRGAGN